MIKRIKKCGSHTTHKIVKLTRVNLTNSKLYLVIIFNVVIFNYHNNLLMATWQHHYLRHIVGIACLILGGFQGQCLVLSLPEFLL